jgi:hypothetical protein
MQGSADRKIALESINEIKSWHIHAVDRRYDNDGDISCRYPSDIAAKFDSK